MMSCAHRDDAGPWVLGALDDDAARDFAEHLRGCAICRDEVAQLQVVADVLPMAAPQVVPPPALKSRLMAVVESEAQLLRAAGPDADRPPMREPARRSSWLPAWLGRMGPVAAAALATLLLALGVVAGVLLSDDGTSTTSRPGFGPKGTEVALHVTGHHGELDLTHMPAPPVGRVYQVWLVTGKGKPRPTHTLFTVPSDGRARVDIMESLEDTDQVLVTAEPPGGSSEPTSDPIVGARLHLS
jgi:anti-sigma-K factor RskA